MMIAAIKEALARDGRASDWKILERRKSGLEWYFVGRELDSARKVDKTLYDLTVWADGMDGDVRVRGECSATVHPGTDPKELAVIVGRALDTASGMKNPWFPLPEPDGRKAVDMASPLDGMDPSQAMELCRAALYRHDGLGSNGQAVATINSLELFLSRMDLRLLTSRGVDARWVSWHGFTEFVVNAGVRGKDEVELYCDCHFSEPDGERLAALAKRQLEAARDRLGAVPTPRLEGLPLLLSGEPASQIYQYWFDNVQAQAVYERRAAFAVGDDVSVSAEAGEGAGAAPIAAVAGDAVSLKAVPGIPGCPGASPYDSVGYVLEPVELIKENKVLALEAPCKYAHYLGIKPTGAFGFFELGAGRESADALKEGDHLEVLTFSDFYMDTSSGDFGGEIRLGYLQRDGKRVPVRGGSVTGNLTENRGLVRLSAELGISPSARGPEYCLLPRVQVTHAD